jgi:uroporphyrinogen decarboxylase
MLDFQRRWDLDILKIMSSGVYCVEDWGCKVEYAGAENGAKQCKEHAVRQVEDWRFIRPLEPAHGAYGRELLALDCIVRQREDDGPILHTVFSPLTIARKLAGDRVQSDLRSAPALVSDALASITETLVKYVRLVAELRADGIFFATQAASPEMFTLDEWRRFELPLAKRILEEARARSLLLFVHVHGRNPYFADVARLPADALNWHDRLTSPSLAAGRREFPGAVVGGIDEWGTLRSGDVARIEAEVRDVERQTGGRRVIIGPGCALPVDVDDEALRSVLTAIRRLPGGSGQAREDT